eukprot:scaffold1201_cov199-Alexandrium_tamarense.AAC.11
MTTDEGQKKRFLLSRWSLHDLASITMAITSYQQGLLARHNVSYTRGLTFSEASQRRSRVGEGGLNTVQP